MSFERMDDEDQDERDTREDMQLQEDLLVEGARYTFWCFPCGFMAKVSSKEQIGPITDPHAECTFEAPAYPRTDSDERPEF